MIKKQNFEVCLIFIVACLLSIGNLENICKIFVPLNFDNQALLVWEYSASLGMLPYRDIFYPYGLLYYFKSQNAAFSLLYFFLTPLLFTGVFIILKNLFKDKLFSYFSFFIFFLFIFVTTGFETFNRYGIVVVLSFLFACLFFFGKKFFYRSVFLTGILVGIVFSLINDQGIYALLLFFVFSIFDILVGKGFNVYKIIKEGSTFVVGFCIGVIPFFVYLAHQHALVPFLTYFKRLPELSFYAKTPFFHSIITSDNMFTFTALFVTLLFLVYKLLVANKRASFNTYIQVGLVCILILLEQKSIIRSMDNQLIFIGLLLFVALFYELKEALQKYKTPQFKTFLLYGGIMIIIFFLIGIRFEKFAHQYFYRNNVIKVFQTVNTKKCVDNTMQFVPKEFGLVKDKLTVAPGFNGKIFSYPTDPIFYILFNQHPPQYTNAYDGSALAGQSDSIAYIQKNNIQYVIINTKIKALQDEVPDYIRTPHEFAYIINNFTPHLSVGNFLILKKDEKKDFFNTLNSKTMQRYAESLLTINLEDIPRSEGYHKKKYLGINRIIIEKISLKEVNTYLKKNNIISEKKFLVLEFKKGSREKSSFIIKTKDGLETEVKFGQCEVGVPCVINLSRLPLFYKDRVLKEITGAEDKISKITLLDVADESHFW